MSDRQLTDLDRVWEQIPTGTAPTTDLVAAGERARRRRDRKRVALGALLAASVVVVSTAVAGDLLGGRKQHSVLHPEEFAAHGGQLCPDQLPIGNDPGGHGFGVGEHAEAPPVFPDFDSAWVCEYRPLDDGRSSDGNGMRVRWERFGTINRVPDSHLPLLTRALHEITVPPPSQGCTLDLGSRVMLVLNSGGDLTGVVTDDYGCGSIRLTDEPFTNPIGESTQAGIVPGVLAGPAGTLAKIRALASSSLLQMITTPPSWRAYPQAQITGVLRVENGCTLIGESVAFWPHETTWNEATQTVEYRGRPWAEVGEPFTGSGGTYRNLNDLKADIGAERVRQLEQCMNLNGVVFAAFVYGSL